MKDKDLRTLYNKAIEPIFNQSQHKHFLTQKEFIKHSGTIFLLKLAVNNLEKKL